MTMRTNGNGQTAWEYEREAEAHRHRLVETLDELNSRLSPGQMLDEVLSYARIGGGNFGNAAMNAAKHHPIPTLLIGAGVMLFMSDKLGLGLSERIGIKSSGSTVRSTYRAYPRDAGYGGASAETAGWGGQAGRGMAGSAPRVGESAGQSGGGLRERVTDMGQSISDTASSAADRVRDAAEGAREQMAYAADRTSETARDLAYRTRSFAEDQPLLTVAIGAAAGGLLAAMLPRWSSYRWGYSGYGSSYSRYDSPYADEDYGYGYGYEPGSRGAIERARGAASLAAERARETAAMAAEQARETAEGVRQQVSGAASHVAETARELGQTVQDYSASVREQAAYAADRTSETARHMAYRTRSFAEEQPLMTAAIGIALGALLAAVLPKSRMENEYLGETSDSVKRSLRETASEQYRSLKSAAGRVAEDVGSAAREEGLTPDGAAAAARDLGERVRRVAEEGADAAKSEMDRMSRGER
jgi:ElaB/YqjD/DUF883 family membrane-anchored ribosome-binding protein